MYEKEMQKREDGHEQIQVALQEQKKASFRCPVLACLNELLRQISMDYYDPSSDLRECH